MLFIITSIDQLPPMLPPFSSICFPSISCAEPQVTASFHNLTISPEIRGGIKSQGKLSPFRHCYIQNVAMDSGHPNLLKLWHVFMLWLLFLQFHADVHVDFEFYLNVLMFSPLISYLRQFCQFNAPSKSNVSHLSPELRSSIWWSAVPSFNTNSFQVLSLSRYLKHESQMKIKS